MRAIQNQNWKYSVSRFEKLSERKAWSVRFRVEYAIFLGLKASFSGRIRRFILNSLAVLNLARYALKWLRKEVSLHDKRFIILLSNNNAYLQHVLPVARELTSQYTDVVILCPANHYTVLCQRLPAELRGLLHPFESISLGGSYLGRVWRILWALAGSSFDALWFMLQPVRASFLASAVFQRYGFTQRLFDQRLRRVLTPAHTLVAANDHWMWESLLYRAATAKGARGYILQHGVLEEISYPLFGTQFLAWGEYDTRRMTETFRARPEEVATTGSPYFDTLYTSIQSGLGEHEPFERPFITFLSQPFVSDGYLPAADYQQIVDRFFALVPLAEKHGKKLVVKLHPRDKNDEGVYAATPAEIELSREPLFEVLAKSCICITVDSTAIFEAAMFHVPALQAMLPDAERKLDFSPTGISLLTESETALKEVMQKLLGDRAYYSQRVESGQKALGVYFRGLDGQAMERIMKILGQQ